jgi:hypothetical protein
VLTLPKLAIGDRLVVRLRNRPENVFLVSGFTPAGHPLTRMHSLGTWGIENEFPAHVEGLELVEVIPARPRAEDLTGVRALVFTGETYPVRDHIKRLGARWLREDRVWRLDLTAKLRSPAELEWIAGELATLEGAGCVVTRTV